MPPPGVPVSPTGGTSAIAAADGLAAGVGVGMATIHGGGVPSGVVPGPSTPSMSVGTTPASTGVAVGDGWTSWTGFGLGVGAA